MIKYHDMSLLNNVRIQSNTNGDIYIWIYHDKNYKNGTFYCITSEHFLTLCTIRNGEYTEEAIKWKNL